MTQDKAHPTPPAVPIEPRGCPTPGACSSIAAIAERAAVLEEAAQVALRLCDHRPPDQVADAIRRLAAPVASNTTAEPAPIQPAGVEVESLPKLPRPAVHAWADISEHFLREHHYTAEQMRAYALQAIRAAASQGNRGKT